MPDGPPAQFQLSGPPNRREAHAQRTQAEGVDRRRVERRHRFTEPYRKLGWDVVDTNDAVS
jgi:hypothetical protein